MMAREAALKEIADSRLRRLLAFNKSSNCTDIKIGDAELLYKAERRKSAPQRWGPALIFDIDGTGVTVKAQSHIFKVARFCAREAELEAELDPARVRPRQSESDPGYQLGQIDAEKDMEVDREDGNSTSSTGISRSGCSPQPEMIPVPDSPPLSAQLPTQQPSKMTLRHLESSLDRTCEPSQAPRADGAQYEKLTWGQIHVQRSRREYREKRNRKRS